MWPGEQKAVHGIRHKENRHKEYRHKEYRHKEYRHKEYRHKEYRHKEYRHKEYCHEEYRHEEYSHKESAQPKKFKTRSSAGKVRLTVFWNTKWFFIADILEKETTINPQRYIENLTALTFRRPDLNGYGHPSRTALFSLGI